MNIYYPQIRSNGSFTPLIKADTPKEGAVTYPSIALGMSGRTFLGWAETRGEKGSQALLLRGRLTSPTPAPRNP